MAECDDAGVRYRGKVTIVTGGGRGIGKACVETFVKHGSKVVVAEMTETLGTDLENEMKGKGPGDAIFIKCDVTKEDDVKGMIDQTISKYGRIDCVINNAGIATGETIDTLSVENFENLMKVNIIGPFLVSKYALPHLRKTKGHIINISSIFGVIGQKATLAYTTSKAALIGFTKTLAVDEAPNGVRVNAVALAAVDTPMVAGFLAGFEKEEAVRFYREQNNLMGRLGDPAEIAMACLYYAADATFCTGSVLHLTAGAELDYGIKHGLQDIFTRKDQ